MERSFGDRVDFLDGAQQGFRGFRGWGGCGEDWGEFFFGLEYVLDCETSAVVFHFLGVDVNQCEDVFDGPAFAVLVFRHEVGDFDSGARVEVITEDAADSTADAAADRNYLTRRGGGGGGGGGGGCQCRMACFREDLDITDQHVHVCENADTVLDGVEGFGLVGGGAGEYDGGGECEER